jgi:uracil-DNA glycosylase
MNWSEFLLLEKQKPYFKKIWNELTKERASGKQIYPRQADLFNALKYTPYEHVKVVILGQDPYHGPGQAHGLSFSVPKGIKAPPSLRNIFKELQRDLGLPIPNHGCLEAWARQGVLLLNAALSVEASTPQSHAKLGWEQFTDQIIQRLNCHKRPIIFLLWGSSAQKKAVLIDQKRHVILTAPHPSPLSAHRGFIGCGHFSLTNKLLVQNGQEPIDWRL